MKCHLITIGNEILSGSTLDTNSHFIAKKFNEIGIEVIEKSIISDEAKIIKKTLKKAFETADLVVTTGGLGPTKDDITKKTIADYFDDKLIINKKALEHVHSIFKKLGREVNKLNENQALVPSIAEVIINPVGTAPCLWIEKNKKLLIVLPGVPFEMEEILSTKIIPLLKKNFKLPYIVAQTALILGIPESILAEKLQNWEESLSKSIVVSYLPSGSRIKLKLTKIGEDKKKIESELNAKLLEVKEIIGNAVSSISGEVPEDILVDFLLKNDKTVAVAESCTGGKLSHSFVSRTGSSKYYMGSITSYATVIKKNILKIPDSLLMKHSAISEQCAEAMAKEIAFLMDADLGISTTGVAGPAKDEANNKVGLAFIGIFYKGKTFSKEFYFPHISRTEFIDRIAKKAIEFAVEICIK